MSKASKKALRERVKVEKEEARVSRHEQRISGAASNERAMRKAVRKTIERTERELAAKRKRLTALGYHQVRRAAATDICQQLGMPVDETLEKLGLLGSSP